MSDDAFHEIQLNGKQLVFLFMAATVVSVVIFLCGVMVGRGVRPASASAAAVSDADPAPAGEAPSAEPPPVAAAAPVVDTPPDPQDEADTFDALTDKNAPKDVRLSPPAEEAPKPEPREAARRSTERPAPAEEPVQASAPAAVTGSGFVVQIAALRDRTEADAIVKRLAGKGYQAFVVNPVPGNPPVYKVQVGRFPERREADRIAARLKSEEQFSPWVTR